MRDSSSGRGAGFMVRIGAAKRKVEVCIYVGTVQKKENNNEYCAHTDIYLYMRRALFMVVSGFLSIYLLNKDSASFIYGQAGRL